MAVQILPYCVYVLISEVEGDLYTGFTTDLPRRPFRLLFREYHASKADALKRETYLKTTAGKRTLRLMLREALSERRGNKTTD